MEPNQNQSWVGGLMATLLFAVLAAVLGLGAMMLIPEDRLPPLEDNTAPQQAFYPPVED